MSSNHDKEIEGLIRFFFERPGGPDKVFVASCCNRVLVTVGRPSLCRTCGKAPEVREVTRKDLGG